MIRYVTIDQKENKVKMNKENICLIPKNTFDMKAIKDKIAEFKGQHDEIVYAAKSCTDKYGSYCEIQKNLLKSKLQECVFGVCKHANIEWDKNRYEGGSKGFWVCADCNEILGRNNLVMETNGGWVTKNENEKIDKILVAFFEEYPDIDTDICHHD